MVQGHLIASHWISLWCKHNRNVTGKHSDPQQYWRWICRTNLQMRLWSLSWSGEWDEVAVHLCWACSEVSEAEAAVLISILHGPRWLAHAKAITYRTHSLSLIHLELPPALWPPLLIPPLHPCPQSLLLARCWFNSVVYCYSTCCRKGNLPHPFICSLSLSTFCRAVLHSALCFSSTLLPVASFFLSFFSLEYIFCLSCFLACEEKKFSGKKKNSRRNLELFSFSFYLFLSSLHCLFFCFLFIYLFCCSLLLHHTISL